MKHLYVVFSLNALLLFQCANVLAQSSPEGVLERQLKAFVENDNRIYKQEVKFEGARPVELKGKAAGLSLSALPGARYVSSEDLHKEKTPIKSGLLLLDMDFVPHELPKNLAEEGYTLLKNGKMRDAKGNPVLMILRAQVFALYDEKQGALTLDQGQKKSWLDVLVPTAKAGNPYPLRCATWAWRRTYNGGFCRSITARTSADAWGPDEAGGCGPNRPHTRIDYIETRAEIGSLRDRDSCTNCDSELSRRTWNIGCFWPAFGGGSTFHYAHVNDGGIRGTATAIGR